MVWYGALCCYLPIWSTTEFADNSKNDENYQQ